MPDFQRVHRRLGARVAFLGINQRDQRQAAEESARTTGVICPVAVDSTGQSLDAFGGRGMPTTVLLVIRRAAAVGVRAAARG